MSDAAPAAPAAPTCSRLARLRPWAPTLLGLAFFGAGLLAIGGARQGLRITVEPAEAPKAEADPMALLRDDVTGLARDLDELRQDTGGGLTALATAQEEAAATRAEALTRRLETLDRRLGAVLDRQAAIERRLGALGTVAVVPTGAATGAEAGPAAPAEPAAPEPAPVAAAPAAPEPAPAAKPGGLFSFRSGGVDFDVRQRFEVVPALSRVGFDAKSTLHDFTGATSDVEGWFEARLGDPADARGEVSAKVATLKTGIDGRDEELCKRMEAEKHPAIRFALTGFRGARVDRGAKTVQGEVTGELTIHGVARQVVVPVRASIDASKRLVVEGEVPVVMSTHGVEPPDLGVIVVEDQVRVWLALRLRAMGKVGS